MSTVESMDVDILKKINDALSTRSLEELEEIKVRSLEYCEGRETVSLFLQDAIQMFIDRKNSVRQQLERILDTRHESKTSDYMEEQFVTKVEAAVMERLDVLNQEVHFSMNEYMVTRPDAFMLLDKFDISRFLWDYAMAMYGNNSRQIQRVVKSLEKRICEEVRWTLGIRFKSLRLINDLHNVLLSDMRNQRNRERTDYSEVPQLKFAYTPNSVTAAI